MSSINSDESEPGIDAKNDIDARADTICLGANWRLSSASGQCCDVYGLHDDFKGTKDIPIARVATLICDEHRRVHILIVNQAIYFGSSLDYSLISPNKVIHFRIPVSDNPYDSGQDFGIDHEYQFIPFNTEGSTVFQLFCSEGF